MVSTGMFHSNLISKDRLFSLVFSIKRFTLRMVTFEFDDTSGDTGKSVCSQFFPHATHSLLKNITFGFIPHL